MSGWAAKRFWKETTVEAVEDGYQILLDGRQVKSPAKTALVVPTQDLAEVIRTEWDSQEGEIDPLSMPATRMANAAMDKVLTQKDEVASMLAAYGSSDLLCYRADAPEELIARQSQLWDPLLDWLDDAFGVRLNTGSGVMPVAQSPENEAKLLAKVMALSHFELAAFHDLVGLSGSLVIGLAVSEGHLTAEEAWPLSRVDENWQEEQWGADEEATEIATRKRGEFFAAARHLGLVRRVN